MEVTWIPYETEIEVLFPTIRTVREFRGWRVCATEEGAVRLVVDDRRQKHATVWEYDSPEERERDIRMILNIPDDSGPAGAAVPAVLNPVPPCLHARDAKPLPDEEL